MPVEVPLKDELELMADEMHDVDVIPVDAAGEEDSDTFCSAASEFENEIQCRSLQEIMCSFFHFKKHLFCGCTFLFEF